MIRKPVPRKKEPGEWKKVTSQRMKEVRGMRPADRTWGRSHPGPLNSSISPNKPTGLWIRNLGTPASYVPGVDAVASNCLFIHGRIVQLPPATCSCSPYSVVIESFSRYSSPSVQSESITCFFRVPLSKGGEVANSESTENRGKWICKGSTS